MFIDIEYIGTDRFTKLRFDLEKDVLVIDWDKKEVHNKYGEKLRRKIELDKKYGRISNIKTKIS